MEQTIGVLIIHGFGGNTDEVGALAKRLESQGFCVSVPLLPGHGQNRRILAKATRKQWQKTVEEAYEELSAGCNLVWVVGFSMGGLLAVHLLAKDFPVVNRQDIKLGGLVTVNTPVYYWNFRQIFCNLLREKKWTKYGKSIFAYPLRSMLQFQLLLSVSKRLYGRIYCPTLVLQAADDDTVWPSSGNYILKRVQGESRLLKLSQGGHQIFQSRWAEEACEDIVNFICAGRVNVSLPEE